MKKLTLGVRLCLDEVMEMIGKVMLGRVRGLMYSVKRWKPWVNEEWVKVLHSLLVLNTLTRVLFALWFALDSEATWVLSLFWNMVETPILLK